MVSCTDKDKTSSDKKKSAQGHFIVRNDKGLHTRPCTEIVKCTARFKAHIQLVYQSCKVNAKSLLSILMLAATKGSKIRIEAVGEDADQAVESLVALANALFYIKY